MSRRHARRRQDRTTAGGVILMVSSCLAAVLVIAGLVYAMGTGKRHEAALAAAGCEPSLSPSGLQCTTARMLASEVRAVVTPARTQLNADVAAYSASERHHLAAAETALTAEVATEHALDTNLAGIDFPPAIAPMVKALIRADQARVNLIAKQARSSSLRQMWSFDRRIKAANAAVQAEMKLISRALDLAPQTRVGNIGT